MDREVEEVRCRNGLRCWRTRKIGPDQRKQAECTISILKKGMEGNRASSSTGWKMSMFAIEIATASRASRACLLATPECYMGYPNPNKLVVKMAGAGVELMKFQTFGKTGPKVRNNAGLVGGTGTPGTARQRCTTQSTRNVGVLLTELARYGR